MRQVSDGQVQARLGGTDDVPTTSDAPPPAKIDDDADTTDSATPAATADSPEPDVDSSTTDDDGIQASAMLEALRSSTGGGGADEEEDEDLGEHARELWVLLLDGGHGGSEGLANGGLGGLGLDVRPAGAFGHPEDVLCGVLVAVFEEGGEFLGPLVTVPDVIVALFIRHGIGDLAAALAGYCLLYTSPSPRD